MGTCCPPMPSQCPPVVTAGAEATRHVRGRGAISQESKCDTRYPRTLTVTHCTWGETGARAAEGQHVVGEAPPRLVCMWEGNRGMSLPSRSTMEGEWPAKRWQLFVTPKVVGCRVNQLQRGRWGHGLEQPRFSPRLSTDTQKSPSLAVSLL